MRKTTYAFVTAAAMAGALTLGGVARAGDVEIVNPSTGQAAPAPAAVAPVQTVPVQEQAPVAAPHSQKVVHEDVNPPHNVMTTITVSALMGGIAGLRRYHELPRLRSIWRQIEVPGVPAGTLAIDQ